MGHGNIAVVDREGGIRELVLDRPAALNAISTQFASEFGAACRDASAAPGVRVVVVTSSCHRAFCVGADLKERDGFTDDDLMRQRLVFREMFTAIWNLPQPLVVAVHGFALGGGTEIALCADLIVADRTAVFGLPEVTVGLVPGGGGTQLLPRRVGSARAADLVLTGRRVDVDEAAMLGLTDRVVPAGTDRDEALSVAQAIAANSPVAVRAAKRAMRLGNDAGVWAGFDVEDAAWRTAAFSADRREGIAAFIARRRPVWPG
jgi:enoyl-CoA hydratase/carnithine racemase